jgi:isoleucyl-tRNA synthetase
VREGSEVKLDTTLTPELKAEGELRDLIRTIQDLRKKADLMPADRITLMVTKKDSVIAEKYKDELLSAVGATSYAVADTISVNKVPSSN